MKKPSIQLRLIARAVVIISLFLIVYITSKNKEGKLSTFAKQSENLQGKGKIVACAPDYVTEINKYEGCFPKKCARYVTDQIISHKEANKLLEIAKKGLEFGGSSGGASILDLHSGALSKGDKFINIYKIKEANNLFTSDDFNLYRVCIYFIYITTHLSKYLYKYRLLLVNLLDFYKQVRIRCN